MSTNIMALYNDSDSDSDNEFFTNKSSARLTRNTSTIYRPGVYEDEENFPEFEVTKNLSKFNRDSIFFDDTESIGSDFEPLTVKKFLKATDMDSVDSDNDFEPYMRGRKLVIATNDPIDNFLGDDREEEEELQETGVESFADTKEELSRVGETVHAEETAPPRNPSLKLLKGKLASKRAIEEARAAARDAKAGKSAKGVLALQQAARARTERLSTAQELADRTRGLAAQEELLFDVDLPPIENAPAAGGGAVAQNTNDFRAVLTSVESMLGQAVTQARIDKAKDMLKGLVAKFKGKRLLQAARDEKAKLSKSLTDLAKKYSKPQSAGGVGRKARGAKANVGKVNVGKASLTAAPSVNTAADAEAAEAAEPEVEAEEEAAEADNEGEGAAQANTKTTTWTSGEVTVKQTVSTRKGAKGNARNAVFYKGERITAGKAPLTVITNALEEATKATDSDRKSSAVEAIKKIARERRKAHPEEAAAEAMAKAARAAKAAAAPAAAGGRSGSTASRSQSVSKVESAAGGRSASAAPPKRVIKLSGGGGGKK